MEIGISTASFYPMLSEEGLRQIGLHHVPCAEFFSDTISEIQPGYIKGFREIADFYGVKVASLHPFTSGFEPFMLFTGYKRRFLDGLEYHRHFFDAMNLLGADIFVFHGDRAEGFLSNQEYFERFAMLRDLGKSYGIRVAQENVQRCKSGSFDFLKEMVRYLKGDVSFVFDNKQAHRSGIDYAAFIEAFHEQIIHIHISDNDPDHECLPIGKGTVDFVHMFSLLKAKGYQGNLIVELYRDDLESLEDIYQSYQKLCLFK